MKVLFLTKYPFNGASSRYRVLQYLPYLEKLGLDFEVSSFMSKSMYETSFKSGHKLKKFWQLFIATIQRLWLLRRYNQFDIIYMQRELLPFGPPVIEKLLKKSGVKLVYDYDDALFIAKVNQYNPLMNYLRNPNKTLDIFAMVDCVMAGNNYLRDAASKYCHNAITFEVAEDTQRIKFKTLHNNERIVIGWLGSKTTVKYLNLIGTTLLKIHAKYPNVEFWVMGGDKSFNIAGLPIKNLDWSLNAELDALHAFDIGLMPLPDEEWSKGKSGGKARTYMTAGVVPVVTGIGYNLELIQHAKTGMICNSENDWFYALNELVKNHQLRNSIATNARQYVEQYFQLEKQSRVLFDILCEVKGA